MQKEITDTQFVRLYFELESSDERGKEKKRRMRVEIKRKGEERR